VSNHSTNDKLKTWETPKLMVVASLGEKTLSGSVSVIEESKTFMGFTGSFS
jgi:hypothetical protein